MTELAGRPGTWGGLALRAGQFVFAASCICVMASAPGFANYTAFCYLIASMGLQALWSLGLACLDCCALILRKDLQQAFLLSLFVVGDWRPSEPPMFRGMIRRPDNVKRGGSGRPNMILESVKRDMKD